MNEPVERVEVSACRVPAEQPESDGTLTWDSTTIVIAQAVAGGVRGIGYGEALRSPARHVARRGS